MGLDSVELLVEIEKEFGIEISDLEAENIYTIGDFYEVILKKDSEEKNIEDVLQRLKTLISNKLGMDIKKLKLEMSIVNDLGLD